MTHQQTLRAMVSEGGGGNGFWPLTNEFFFTVLCDSTNNYFMPQLLPPVRLRNFAHDSVNFFHLVVILFQQYSEYLGKVNVMLLG